MTLEDKPNASAYLPSLRKLRNYALLVHKIFFSLSLKIQKMIYYKLGINGITVRI